MNEAAAPVLTPLPLKARLYLMMFLQYFVQGSYLPIASVYLQDGLGFDSTQMGIFVAALAIGPLLAPFILGQLVDRVLPTERVLAICHFAAGLLMLALYWQTQFLPVLAVATLYSLLYVPTMMLTNSLAFHHLRQREREFPAVRVWGTIGFVAPAWLIEWYWLHGLTGAELNSARGVAFLLAGVAELGLALYCLTLPSTPPQSKADAPFAPGAVLGLLRRRDFQVLVVVAFLIAFCHQFFFLWNSPFLKWFLRQGDILGAWEQRISSLGQVSEIAVMAALGLVLVRLGFKWVLALGALAYLLRCLIFAAVPPWTGPYWTAMGLVVLGQALHGFCFGCFWATAFIYVDRTAPADVRGSAQLLFGTVLFGLGAFVGGFTGGGIGNLFSTGSGDTLVRNWSAIWLSSAGLAAFGLLVFVLLFPRRYDLVASMEQKV